MPQPIEDVFKTINTDQCLVFSLVQLQKEPDQRKKKNLAL